MIDTRDLVFPSSTLNSDDIGESMISTLSKTAGREPVEMSRTPSSGVPSMITVLRDWGILEQLRFSLGGLCRGYRVPRPAPRATESESEGEDASEEDDEEELVDESVETLMRACIDSLVPAVVDRPLISKMLASFPRSLAFDLVLVRCCTGEGGAAKLCDRRCLVRVDRGGAVGCMGFNEGVTPSNCSTFLCDFDSLAR